MKLHCAVIELRGKVGYDINEYFRAFNLIVFSLNSYKFLSRVRALCEKNEIFGAKHWLSLR